MRSGIGGLSFITRTKTASTGGKAGQQAAREFHRRALDQLVATLGEDALRCRDDFAIVERVDKMIRSGRARQVGLEFEMDKIGLAEFALVPVPAMVGVQLEVVDQYLAADHVSDSDWPRFMIAA